MTLLVRVSVVVLMAVALNVQVLAWDGTPPSEARTLVAFASDEGMARLSRSTAKADFPLLANQFEAQSNAAFCGPATATIVLNAIYGRRADLPRDRSRLRAEDLTHMPSTVDPTVPRFTQETVFTKGAKTRAQVLGEPFTVDGKQIVDFGFQVRQLDELLRAHGLSTKLVIADDKKSDAEIRAELVANLKRRGDYIIVSYRRDAVGQKGGGHISPLGAYDAESDSFLILDVNPTNAGWVWMPAATLFKGMRTPDKTENRGYILVQSLK